MVESESLGKVKVELPDKASYNLVPSTTQTLESR